MKGFARFQKSLLKVLVPAARTALHENRDAMMKSLGDDVLGEGPEQLTPMRKNPSPEQTFLNFLRSHFGEISDSLTHLETVGLFLRRYSQAASKVEPATYVRYHVEAYLHEIYLLYNRLTAFLTWLKRAYRKHPAQSAITKIVAELGKVTHESFAGIVETRGGHVHQSRFEDAALRRLSLLDLLSKSGDAEFQDIYENAQRRIRREKVSWVSRNNAAVKQYLDALFEVIHPIVFAEDGQLNLPWKTAG